MTPPATTILEPRTDVIDRSRSGDSQAEASHGGDSATSSSPAPSEVEHVLCLTPQADRVKLRGRVLRG